MGEEMEIRHGSQVVLLKGIGDFLQLEILFREVERN